MVSDSEPRYRLVDADGNVVGSIYAQADGTLAIQEGTSASDNEATLATDGTWQVPSVDTDDLFNTDNPFTVRFWNDGGTWRAHGRTEEIASGSDPDSVLNTAIQNIPNYTSNGAKITFQDDWTQSSQIVVPGTGAYDDNYFPLVFDFETAGVVIEQADGANLDPAWKIETGETNGTHAVGFINPHFEGNRANNSSGGAIKVVQPTGHQSLIRGLFIEHPYILRWPGYCINAERNLYGNLEGGAVGYTDNSFALAWQGNVFGTRVEYAGAEGAWISGYMGGGKIHNNQTNGLVLGDLPNRSTEVTVSQANPQVVRNDRASGNNAEVKTNYNVLFSGTVDGDDSSHPAWNPAGQRARFQGHTFRVSEEVKGGAIGNNSLRGYRGSRTGTPPDLWDGDWWIRQDLSPVELRTYDEQNGTIHHFQRDGSSAP